MNAFSHLKVLSMFVDKCWETFSVTYIENKLDRILEAAYFEVGETPCE